MLSFRNRFIVNLPSLPVLIILMVFFTSVFEAIHSRKVRLENLLNPLAHLAALAILLIFTGAGNDLFSSGKEGSLKDYMYEKVYTNDLSINKSIVLVVVLTVFTIKFLEFSYNVKLFLLISSQDFH